MKYVVNCIFVNDGESFTCICEDYGDLRDNLDEIFACYQKEQIKVSIVSVKNS